MEWISVIILIVFGLALLITEIIFIPGTTFVGIMGAASMLVGIWMSFDYFGSDVGWIVFACTGALTSTAIYFGFKTKVWNRFALKSTIESKVNEGLQDGLLIGQVGTSVSALRPVGKVDFGNRILEARSLGAFVDEGKTVKIIKIESDRIIVEPNE